MPALFDAHDWHCAYCDRHPMFNNDKTIDHFKPKSKFWGEAYKWENLFPVCDTCQTSKMEQYDDLLLKPDEVEYNFNLYFIIDFLSFELKSNPLTTEYNQSRAEYTIRLLNLNQPAHCISRMQTKRLFNQNTYTNVNDYAYRYLF